MICRNTFHLGLQAVVPALTHWISALLEAVWEPVGPRLHPILQIIGLPMLANARLLETLLWTVTSYLDSQQKWHNYAQNGLSSFLVALYESMHGHWGLVHGIDILSTASGFLPDALIVHSSTVGYGHVPACIVLAC